MLISRARVGTDWRWIGAKSGCPGTEDGERGYET